MTNPRAIENAPPYSPENSAHIGGAAVATILPSAGEGAAWLAERQIELQDWRAETEKGHPDWLEAQHADNTAWAERHDITTLLEKSQSDDAKSLEGLQTFIQKADLAELLDPKLEGMWRYQPCRTERYERITAVLGEALRNHRTFDAVEGRLLIAAFRTLGLGREATDDIFRCWQSYETTLKPYHIEYDRQVDNGLREGDIVERRFEQLLYNVSSNFAMMDALHTQDPRSLQILYGRDGIRNFGQYDFAELYNQFFYSGADEVVLSGAFDWNGGASNMLRDVEPARTVDMGTPILRTKKRRYMEARNADEAKQLLKTFVSTIDKTTGQPFGPIEMLILNPHANPYTMRLGDELITVDDILAGDLVDNTVIARRATIWLTGCEAAKKQRGSMNIMQAIQKVTGAFVFGAKDKPNTLGRTRRGPVFRNAEGKNVTVRARPPLLSYLRRPVLPVPARH